MSVKRYILEYLLPTRKMPSGQMRRMGITSCTRRGTRYFSLSCWRRLLRVFIMPFINLSFMSFYDAFQRLVIQVGWLYP